MSRKAALILRVSVTGRGRVLVVGVVIDIDRSEREKNSNSSASQISFTKLPMHGDGHFRRNLGPHLCFQTVVEVSLSLKGYISY
jgi:hypothetical protein